MDSNRNLSGTVTCLVVAKFESEDKYIALCLKERKNRPGFVQRVGICDIEYPSQRRRNRPGRMLEEGEEIKVKERTLRLL
jgi:hypothetical protein